VTLALKSKSQEIVVRGPDVHLQLLHLLFWLAEKNISPFDVLWFYYDTDRCLKDPQTIHRFFLVAKDKIVDENFTLSDWSNNGFDPSLLIPVVESDPTWRSSNAWHEANDRFWYRKFYTETRSGQLMVLRPDTPFPYYYHEGRYKSVGGVEGWLAETHKVVRQIRFASWMLVIFVLLELCLHWK
jgi:hypothetical protein